VKGACVLVVALCAVAHAEETQVYVVQPGDSCLGIALRVLGDRAGVATIHKLNPELGALPHDLAVGSTLRMPAQTPQGPDARLTRAAGEVKIRRPSTVSWDTAERGMDLFRAYRIGAATRASAELTFADRGRLDMRERTIVVIYGPEKRLAKQIVATAELERGTLESRLGELDGRVVVVKTTLAEASLAGGQAVLTTGDGGPSIVSNHAGGDVKIASRARRTKKVAVRPGMGTRVVGSIVERPRPLPATPVFGNTSGLVIVEPTGSAHITWQPAARAARYRLTLIAGDMRIPFELDATTTSLDIPFDPGRYQLVIAALDADGLESAPSTPLDLEVVAPTFVSPRGRRPGPGATTPRTVAVGTTVEAPVGMTCADEGRTGAPSLVLSQAGAALVRCSNAAGEQTNAIALTVIPLAR
jgi:hypothetical protein